MTEIPFIKVHNAGNDFILIDGIRHPRPDSYMTEDWIRHVCHRQFGAGADGVLLLTRDEDGTLRMRIDNSDGSRAAMCGNGLSCLARFAVEVGHVQPGSFVVQTDSGIRRPLVERDAGGYRVTIDMGEPVLERSAIPMTKGKKGSVVNETLEAAGETMTFTAVSMGNPHCVIYVDQPVDLHRIGPAVEKHPLFPDRVNAHFVRVLAPDHVSVQVWERGAGPTLACGTGASAIAVAGFLTGRTKEKIRCNLPGGDLDVTYTGEGSVFLTCRPSVVYRGVLSISLPGK